MATWQNVETVDVDGLERTRAGAGQTLTLLLGDVESSTRLWEADRDGAARTLDALHAVVLESARRHHGVVLLEQGEGDSFVAAFARAADAVSCALDLQQTLTRRSLGVAVRAALHTGDVELVEDSRYRGDAFNHCARLRDLAAGGQTLPSRPTHDLVADHVAATVTLAELGTYQLRDLARPEHVYQLCHPELPSDFPPLAPGRRRHNEPCPIRRSARRSWQKGVP